MICHLTRKVLLKDFQVEIKLRIMMPIVPAKIEAHPESSMPQSVV